MAQRFPGRPPDFDNDTATVASSIHDYLDEGDFHRLASKFFDDNDSFWSLPDTQQRLQHQHKRHTEDPRTMTCFPGRPPGSSDLHRLKSEFFDDDDTFWSLLDRHQPLKALSHPTSAPSEAASHLIPSQVYMKRSNRRKIDRSQCVTVSEPRSATLPCSLVSRSTVLNLAPIAYSSSAIPKTKSWRMLVPTSDNLALYAVYVPECYEMACPSSESFFDINAKRTHNTVTTTVTTTVTPPAPVFRTSPAPPVSYPLLKPSLSKDNCTTTTTTTTTTTSSTFCVGIVGHNTGFGFGNSFEGKIHASGESDASVLATLHYHDFYCILPGSHWFSNNHPHFGAFIH